MWGLPVALSYRERGDKMTSIKRMMLIIAVIIFMLPSVSFGKNLEFEINANSDDIEAKLGWKFPLYKKYPKMGVGLIYNDEYVIPKMSLALDDEVLMPGLTLGLGFEGLAGEVEIHDKDFDLRALSFLMLGEYDFSRKLTTLPIKVSASLAVAPDPLSFSDSNRYVGFSSGVYFYVVRDAAIGIGYRTFSARFDDGPREVKRSEDTILFGFKFSF
jgi:hypothetical protein